VPSTARSQDDSYRQAVAHAEAAVAEAEAAAAAAEREAERYSTFRSPRDSGAGGVTG
jgi:multidrug resistance efflux pump